GNPVSLAAASATLDRLLNGLMDNAAKMGSYLIDRLNELKDKYDIIGDVRGKGLMIGVELVKDRDSKEPAKEELGKILEYSFKHGLLVIGAGISTVRFSPPLNITMEVIDEALDIFEDALKNISEE
ncbi:aspartate aminotransferase family protein, partial [Candidatus Geothermarchaeota archaeon]